MSSTMILPVTRVNSAISAVMIRLMRKRRLMATGTERPSTPPWPHQRRTQRRMHGRMAAFFHHVAAAAAGHACARVYAVTGGQTRSRRPCTRMAGRCAMRARLPSSWPGRRKHSEDQVVQLHAHAREQRAARFGSRPRRIAASPTAIVAFSYAFQRCAADMSPRSTRRTVVARSVRARSGCGTPRASGLPRFRQKAPQPLEIPRHLGLRGEEHTAQDQPAHALRDEPAA